MATHESTCDPGTSVCKGTWARASTQERWTDGQQIKRRSGLCGLAGLGQGGQGSLLRDLQAAHRRAAAQPGEDMQAEHPGE